MPYIEPKYRAEVHRNLEDLIYIINTLPEDKKNGIVTYCLYYIVHELFWRNSWDILSDGRKCLDEASREFCRQVIEPYEDQKISENGPI